MIKEEICYQYDSGKDEFLSSGGVDIPYFSLQELGEEFSAAEAERNTLKIV